MQNRTDRIKRAMAVSPHPDDVEIAMGGAIAKMLENDIQVIIIDLTDGEPTPHGTKKLRYQEAKNASQILQVDRVNLDMPNQRLLASIENRHKLAHEIRKFRPDILFTPALPDIHPDHIYANELIHAARFDAKLHKSTIEGPPHWTKYYLQYYSPHRYLNINFTVVMDITEQWHKKLDAVKCYKSQLKHLSNANFNVSLLKKIEITNRYFALSIGSEYAEPFCTDEPASISAISILL